MCGLSTFGWLKTRLCLAVFSSPFCSGLWFGPGNLFNTESTKATGLLIDLIRESRYKETWLCCWLSQDRICICQGFFYFFFLCFSPKLQIRFSIMSEWGQGSFSHTGAQSSNIYLWLLLGLGYDSCFRRQAASVIQMHLLPDASGRHFHQVPPPQYSPVGHFSGGVNRIGLLLTRRLSSLSSQEHGLHFRVGGLLCQKEAGRRRQPRSEHRRVPAPRRHRHHLPGSSGGAEPPGNAGGHGTRGEWYGFGERRGIILA